MRLSTFFIALVCSAIAAGTVSAQEPGYERQEFAVGIAALSGSNPGGAASGLNLGSGLAIEANYAHKLNYTNKWSGVYLEVNALGSPFRHLSGLPLTATSDVRSFYVTPGVRLQFAQQERLMPWVDFGGGYAFYDSSSVAIGGGTTGGGTSFSGTQNTYAVEFGAGVDIVASKRYTIRGDVRGYYTGNPNFGVNVGGGQFNFVIGAEMVWRSPK